MFGWDDAIGIGSSLLGGMFGDDSAEDASQIQAAATDRANERLERQFNTVRDDLAPYRGTGAAANSLLAQYLGLPSGGGAGAGVSRDAVRNRLLPQFTSSASASGVPAWAAGLAPEVLSGLGYGQWTGTPGIEQGGSFVQGPGGTTVDEAGLNAAIDRELAATQYTTNPQGENFGYLLDRFDGQDLENEPGYRFGLEQGMNALSNRLAAGGSYFSGAALKGGQRFAQDYAGTKFDAAFNRDAANKQRIYGMLSGTAGAGQNAAAQTGSAGTAIAGQVANNITGGGNAQAAARIAGGNSWSNAITGGIDNWQQNQLLNRITGGNTGWGGDESWRYTGNGMPR
jgi:hypothetical protein